MLRVYLPLDGRKWVQTGPAQGIVVFPLLWSSQHIGQNTLPTDAFLVSVLCVFANEHHQAIEWQKVGANRTSLRHCGVSPAWSSHYTEKL